MRWMTRHDPAVTAVDRAVLTMCAGGSFASVLACELSRSALDRLRVKTYPDGCVTIAPRRAQLAQAATRRTMRS